MDEGWKAVEVVEIHVNEATGNRHHAIGIGIGIGPSIELVLGNGHAANG